MMDVKGFCESNKLPFDRIEIIVETVARYQIEFLSDSETVMLQTYPELLRLAHARSGTNRKVPQLFRGLPD